jgi:hypothetical protein
VSCRAQVQDRTRSINVTDLPSASYRQTSIPQISRLGRIGRCFVMAHLVRYRVCRYVRRIHIGRSPRCANVRFRLAILRRKVRDAWWALVAIVIALNSCSGSLQNGTKPGAVVVTVSPNSVSLSADATQQFTAIVTGTKHSAVKWELNGVTAGNTVTGTISSGALYKAPATTPSSSVTVTAVSVADASHPS